MDELNKDIDINTPLSGEGETEGEENPILPEEPEEEPSTIPIVISLKKRFPLVSWFDLEWCYKRAKNIWLEKVFPYAYEIVEIPFNLRPRAEVWLENCCLFILKLNNITDGLPLTAYAENGLSYHFDSTMLNDELRSTLPPPMVGIRGNKR